MGEAVKYEVWDRVTGTLFDVFDSEADAEDHIPALYARDFVVIEAEDDEAA